MRQILLVKKALRSILPSDERSPTYYDWTVKLFPGLSGHYTSSRYYFVWTVIVDRLLRANVDAVLDIGCGPGQLACLLRDRGIARYCGLDFSPERINRAKETCPKFEFVQANVLETDLFESFEHNAVLALEFLEHIHGDLQVIDRIKPGRLVLATVPNFPSPGHVRHFKDPQSVAERYQPAFHEFRVDPFLADAHGKTFFLIQGIRS